MTAAATERARAEDPQHGRPGVLARSYTAATDLDGALGDPRDPDNPCGFQAMARRDAERSFPSALAERAGPALRLSFVPASQGGDLRSLDQTLMLVRAAARRDAALMPATMFSITAAACVLLSGSAEQRRRVVAMLREGRSIGFALSESEHGSDLLANECAAQAQDPDGPLRLDGEKWLVGLGDQCSALLLVARTGGRGPAAFSALLLEGADVDAGRTLERHHPTGMRGIGFASFRFEGHEADPESLVGARGHGLETAMKAMQLVRTTSTGANLACADTGLRLAMDFASAHRVAGRPVLSHPHARRELATAAALLFAGDVVALTTARGVHALPAAQSLWSSVAKKVLTESSEEVFTRCADVLGTRAVLRDGPFGAFDACRRDNSVVRYIDTGPVANSRLIAAQLNRLGASRNRGEGKESPPGAELAAVYRVGAELAPLRLEALQLSDRGGDEAFDALPAVAEAVRTTVLSDDRVSPHAKSRTRVLADRLEEAVDRLLVRVGRKPVPGPLDQHDLAHRLCYLHAATACLHLWWFNRDLPLFGAPPGDVGWLNAVLSVLLSRAFGTGHPLPEQEASAVMDIVGRLHADERMFSCTALPLAGSAAAAAPLGKEVQL